MNEGRVVDRSDRGRYPSLNRSRCHHRTPSVQSASIYIYMSCVNTGSAGVYVEQQKQSDTPSWLVAGGIPNKGGGKPPT
jgi:hypothetical protein